MLGPHDELVQIARVLEVVDDVGDDDGEDVQFGYLILKLANGQEVMKGLQGINNVQVVVVTVVLEVAAVHLKQLKQVTYLASKVVQRLR